jgi:eukaryotic-like serine/threonine-protein kinase
MASIIPEYNYDIFISYRQKDNRGDRWVSEFVAALKDELESTFKEEISVYFDINPHDGLLETHDVNASLKEKLKCLIFIPIISRTYCDPKSFAWEHEFIAFVEQASQDQFGLKVKLPNGNVANRVLPIQLYELDFEDKALIESVLGGLLRSIEFIYKEPGVNRPLTPADEEKKNLNKTRYRNQINKTANAIKEIISGLKAVPDVPKERSHQTEAEERIYKDEKRIKEVLKVADLKRDNKILPWKMISIVLIVLMFATIGTFLLYWHLNSLRPLPVHRYSYNLPPGETFGNEEFGSAVALSPDGTKLIIASGRNDTNFLYLQVIDQFGANRIPGTEGAEAPFFSPDGKWVGFFADGYLKKISILGGVPQTICEAKQCFEGCWGQDNTILFSSYYIGLMRVPSTGGVPEQLTAALKYTNHRLDRTHLWPQVLPGGKVILFTSFNTVEDTHISAYSLETGKRWDLVGPGSHARYVKTGHIVYAWKGDMYAVPFDLKKIKVTGQPVLIQKGVMMSGSALSHFSVSENGSLVFITGNVIEQQNRIALVDHKGNSEYLNFPSGRYQSPRFSPDGKNILIVRSQEKSNIWIYGMERGTLSRFSDKDYDAFWAIWSPDGRRIVFNSNLDKGAYANLFWKRSDGTGQAERLITSKYHQQPKCWTKDGNTLLFTEGINPETGMDIWMRSFDGDTNPKPFLKSRFNDALPEISPDGKWMAYVSDESGREEVVVCSFPGKENIVQISTDGGTEPLWAPDGKSLFYRDWSGRKVFEVSFSDNPEPLAGKPALLFQGKFKGTTGLFGRNYDITPDGKHFLMIERGENKSTTNQVNIILNWFEELKQIK